MISWNLIFFDRFQPKRTAGIAGHAPAGPRGEADLEQLRTVRAGGAFELLAEEAPVEGFERGQNLCWRVIFLKALHRKSKNIIRGHLPGDGILEEEIMQLVGSEDVFGLLGGCSGFVQRQQLGRDRRLRDLLGNRFAKKKKKELTSPHQSA